MTGRFLTLEGIEGAGKSTIGKFVLAYLARQQIPGRLTREPGGTPLAERVRQIVLERGVLVRVADRAGHLRDLRAAHAQPPADVKLASVAIPQRIPGVPTGSYCSSPARLCAELAG